MFRDENNTVMRKAKHDNCNVLVLSKLSRISPTRCANEDGNHEIISRSSPNPGLVAQALILEKTKYDLRPAPFEAVSIARNPSPWEAGDLGVAFFLAHYLATVTPRTSTVAEIKNTILYPIYTNQIFFDAVSAVGLAGLSNVRKDQNLMLAARQKYIGTMRHVSSALQTPVNMNIEITLKCIMMLAIFEVDANLK